MTENPTLGKYEILRPLGEGATAVVYLARDTNLGREVALKVLKPHLAGDPEMFKYFLREAQTAASLYHPRIASIYDMGESGGRFYIAMHRIDGPSLNQILRADGPLPVEECLRMAGDVASALDYAHRRGFLHRDVKPANILREADGDYLLTDFGLARALNVSGLTSTNAAVPGTLAYIAPEVWNQQPLTPAVDQYALACVIYEAIDGQTLFQGELAALVAGHVLHGAAFRDSFTSRVTPAFAQALQRGLERDPAARYPTCAALVQALRDGLAAPGLADLPTSAQPQQPRTEEIALPMAQIEPAPDLPVDDISTVEPLGETTERAIPLPEEARIAGAVTAAAASATEPASPTAAAPIVDPGLPRTTSTGSTPLPRPARSVAPRNLLLGVVLGIGLCLLLVLGGYYGLTRWITNLPASTPTALVSEGIVLPIVTVTLPPAQEEAPPPAEGTLAFLTDRDGEIALYTMSADGSDQTWRAATNGQVDRPAYTTDGTALAFRASPKGPVDLYGYNFENDEMVQLTSGDGDEYGATFTSDAMYFFIYWQDQNLTQIKRIDSSGLQVVLEENTYLENPAYSIANDQIAFVINDGSYKHIHVGNPDGSKTQITEEGCNDEFPAWSPDGEWIVFSSDRGGSYDLYRMRPDGSEVTQLTSDEGNETMPAWSPGGQWIAYTSDQGGNMNIFVIDAEGGNPRQLTDFGNSWWPAWAP